MIFSNLKLLGFLGVAIAIVAGLWYIENLQRRLENSEVLNTALQNANINLAAAWSDDRNKTQGEIDALIKAKNKVRVEKEYVEKIKYKIIKENNASCVSAINDIYARLREQSKDNNSTAAAGATKNK